MKISYLKELTDEGHEIELEYRKESYWILWNDITGEDLLYFYKANSNSMTSASSVDELIVKEYNGVKIGDIWESLGEEDVWVS